MNGLNILWIIHTLNWSCLNILSYESPVQQVSTSSENKSRVLSNAMIWIAPACWVLTHAQRLHCTVPMNGVCAHAYVDPEGSSSPRRRRRRCHLRRHHVNIFTHNILFPCAPGIFVCDRKTAWRIPTMLSCNVANRLNIMCVCGCVCVRWLAVVTSRRHRESRIRVSYIIICVWYIWWCWCRASPLLRSKFMQMYYIHLIEMGIVCVWCARGRAKRCVK